MDNKHEVLLTIGSNIIFIILFKNILGVDDLFLENVRTLTIFHLKYLATLGTSEKYLVQRSE